MDATVPLIVVVGATGTGKSDLSLGLAGRLGDLGRPAEIVNADAMQLYRGMDVGTAKLPPAERRGIRHHMLDVLEVTDEASVADYQVEARAAVADIATRGAIPILVGGSGLYVSSVIHDFRFPGTDAVVRARLDSELEQAGPGMLYQRLREADPVAAESIGPHNARRIVRALEVIEITGEPFGAGLPDEKAPWWPDTRVVGVRAPREQLIARLDERVLGMWSSGLLGEVEHLIGAGIERGATASRAIGYAQAIGQLHGELTEQLAIGSTQALTRKYARRQVSWFRRYPGVRWLDYDDPQRGDAALQVAQAQATTARQS